MRELFFQSLSRDSRIDGNKFKGERISIFNSLEFQPVRIIKEQTR